MGQTDGCIAVLLNAPLLQGILVITYVHISMLTEWPLSR